jgi:mono/diheme cytochrome c family protein
MPTRASGGGRARTSTAPLHDGVNKRGQDMYPTMPYDFYTRVTRADVDALYAYLRTVKPVRNAVDVNHLDFPFNVRMGMGVWRELYFNEGTYRPDPRRAPRGNRGAYLVEGLGHCSDCHSPRNLLGGIEKSKAMSGALIDGWFALTSRPTSRPASARGPRRSSRPTSRRGGEGQDDDAGADGGGHPQQPVVPHRRRPSGDGGIPQVPAAGFVARTGRVAPDPTTMRGAQLYTDNCSGCHQSRGRGVPGVFPAAGGNPVVLAQDPNNILKVVDRGIRARNGFIAMPAFNTQLTDQQVAEIANYVRTSWGNRARPTPRRAWSRSCGRDPIERRRPSATSSARARTTRRWVTAPRTSGRSSPTCRSQPLRRPLARVPGGDRHHRGTVSARQGRPGTARAYNAAAKFFSVYSLEPRATTTCASRTSPSIARTPRARTAVRIFRSPRSGAQRRAGIGALAPRFHGLPTNRSHRVTRDVDCPQLVARCLDDAVDAAVLVANCPSAIKA